MISAIAWIPKGVAKAELEQTVLSPEELAALRALQAEAGTSDEESEWEEGSSDEDEVMDEEAAVAKAQAMAATVKGLTPDPEASGPAPGPSDESLAAAMAELDMEHYDDSDPEEAGTSSMNRILGSSGNPGMAFYKDPTLDPYLQGDKAGASDSDSETEAMTLQKNDLLIMAARNEDDVSHLEVWVYEEPDTRGPANLYVHHTILLPAFPLSVAWMDLAPGEDGHRNIAAVGSFEPGIELWDLDRMDAVEPVATLGGADYEATKAAAAAAAGSKGKKGKKKKQLPSVEVRPGSHTDAVLGLSWNREYRNVLASASADHSVKVWDVAAASCTHTLAHHSSKAQAVVWNPAEAPILLSGGFDRRAALVDLRVADAAPASWAVPADVEALAWDPHSPTAFVVAAEDGSVSCFDARKGPGSEAMYYLAAHKKATCALSFCPAVAGLFLTASTDKKVKLWDTRGGGEPALLATQDLKVGAVFSAGFCADAPMLVAAGGAAGTVAVWDTTTCEAVTAFAGVESA
ncbi:putative WD repeat-containing protein C17D11.16 [Auxenochlorella protothecoides]|uniref:Putative WD repeat-containing protein C17D11.16 n=1 Tax=Auxenochlorella protothecoides TaxID=3075 RepID=A0A087SL04_AUXPR|nr:putative WD repeat-containing protein C17D11.16 [Auxenochlorella protothecoides]KFM26408.1 putative WD repeat-containing protein C17D11.16 [Auxenochlorella protothecoides]